VGPGAIEIGYWIRDAAAGRGFATEASRALTAVGFGLEGIERIEIHCATDNAASRRVPEKLGYQPRIGGDATGADRAVYEMSRTQFMGAANGA
jgi:RimJ/RimL family protein N-acetyltransferase